MGFSCEHFPKVCPSCAAQKSLIPALPASTEATILKEGWRSCAWQLARQRPRRLVSRVLAFIRPTSGIHGAVEIWS